MSDVKIWEEEVMIPTYEPGKADRNPMFLEKRVYQGSSGRLYPYPTTEEISFKKKDRAWKAVYLENRYLKVMILPQLGGRIQRAFDKTNGYDFVYYNHVIKPALVGLAGPWISGGIEFNWPQHHRPTTFMPVDHVIARHRDGSATLLCNDIDQMYGTKGITSFTLYPDRAFIEIRGQLYNRTNLPQTFLWWANPAVPVNDYTQSIFPADVHFVMDHGKRDVSRFPIAKGVYYKHDYSEGVDISRYRNIPVPTSYMAEKSSYNFVGGYDYKEKAGLLHIADHHVSPGKKQWTWGCGDFGKAWDRSLTDEDGPYIELMCGVFTDNQPDFTWLKPFEEKTFTQYFMPYKAVGQVKNATVDAALNMEIQDAGEGLKDVHVIVYATAPHQKARVTLYVNESSGCSADSAADRFAAEEQTVLSPENIFEKTFRVKASDASQIRVSVTADRKTLVEYQPQREEIPEMAKPAQAAKKPEEILTTEELYLTAQHLEQYRHATLLPDPYYLEALKRDPMDMRCNNAYGLLLMRRGSFGQAREHFLASIRRATCMTPNPYTSEAMYNLGVCLLYLGQDGEAYDRFYKAAWSNEQQEMSFYYLACISAKRGEFGAALDFVEKGLIKNAHNVKALGLKAALLRVLGRTEEAREQIRKNLEVDPFDYVSRYIELQICRETGRCAADEGGAAEEAPVGEETVDKESAEAPEEKLKEELQALMRCFSGNYLAAARDFMEAGFYEEAIGILSLFEGSFPLADYYRGRIFRLMAERECAEYFAVHGQEVFKNGGRESGDGENRADRRDMFLGKALECFRRAEKDASDYCFPNKLEDIAVLEDAMRMLPEECAKASYYLGCLFYDKLQYGRARQLWEKSESLCGNFPTVHRNLALAYYNKFDRKTDAKNEMEKAFALDHSDARIFLELDQLDRKLGMDLKKRLERMRSYPGLVKRRDDLLLEYITLLNSLGHYEEALNEIMNHTFRPWEGGEGKVSTQYKNALIQMALRDKKAGDFRNAEEKLKRALLYPENLGEGRLEGTKDNHIWFLLGCVQEKLGKTPEAKDSFEKAQLGVDEPAGAMYYYDQPADMILFKGFAKQKSGRRREACACFNKLMDYGQRHLRDQIGYDYFAVSMPDFLIFEQNLTQKNIAHCWYLMGLSKLGFDDREGAEHCFNKALDYEYDHQNCLLYLEMIREGLI